jgi:hypothetical protein
MLDHGADIPGSRMSPPDPTDDQTQCEPKGEKVRIRSNSIITAAAVLAAAVVPALARADIHGFGDFTGFTINVADTQAAPSISIPTGTINLINGGGERRSIFSNAPQAVAGGFTATFTFKGSGGNPDGTCFVLQNAPAGATAVGFQDGYSGMTKSMAIALELDNVGNTNTGLYTNGNVGGTTSSSPVKLFSNDPINVTITYAGSILTEHLVDATTSETFDASYFINLQSVLGTSTPFAGFTASSNLGSNQSISNFELMTPEPATPAVLLIGLCTIGARRRRARR